jgi:hypothetical protein
MNYIFRGTLVVSLKPAYNYSVLNLIQDVENIIEINQIIDILLYLFSVKILSPQNGGFQRAVTGNN